MCIEHSSHSLHTTNYDFNFLKHVCITSIRYYCWQYTYMKTITFYMHIMLVRLRIHPCFLNPNMKVTFKQLYCASLRHYIFLRLQILMCLVNNIKWILFQTLIFVYIVHPIYQACLLTCLDMFYNCINNDPGFKSEILRLNLYNQLLIFCRLHTYKPRQLYFYKHAKKFDCKQTYTYFN